MFGTTRYIREIAEYTVLRLTVRERYEVAIFAEFLARAVLFTLGGIAGKEVVNLGPAGLVIPCTSVLQRVNPGGSEECKSVECLQESPDFYSTIAFASFCFLKIGWLFTGPDWLFFAPVGCSLLLCLRTFSA